MKQNIDIDNRPKCPKCNRLQIIYTKKNSSFWCRLCGHEWKKQDNKEGESYGNKAKTNK